mgnify:CR=1 FL=1|tara:strand:- start:1091 stop:1372 length:282 start_codon:yes stop_codon:yes gene_type:complete
MSLSPVNRHILIEPIEVEEEEQSTVLLPEGYKVAPTEPYTSVKVIKVAEDCQQRFRALRGLTIVVDSSMIQEINFNDSTFCLILENYVLGVLE